MADKKIVIPAKFVAEFMDNPRFKGLGTNGTRPLDMRVFKEVITEVLNNPEFQRSFAKTVVRE
jgi:hypothetical protein